jgi:hypothetical protein
MRATGVSFMLVAVGLVLLPTPTLAQTCPPGELMICAGTRQPHQLRPPSGGTDWQCSCVPAGTGKTTGGGKVQQQKKNVPTVRPNRTPGPND